MRRTLIQSRLLTLIAATTLALAGCTGKEGPPGEQGVEGPEGQAGEPGAPGLPGTPGAPGAPGTPGQNATPTPLPTVLPAGAELPGVVLAITKLEGGTGANGNFQAGDTVKVTFTAKTKKGDAIALTDFASSGILVSGPTSNYQRVIASQSDLLTKSVVNADGSYTYSFAAPLPANYLAPLNDTTALGADQGELTGQPLQAGTYTVGMQAYRSVTIDKTTYRDATVAVKDFLYGTATTIEHREVVKNENCNACHDKIQAHGGSRLDVQYCVLCHTAGAEDRNVATVEGGTPGVTIDFAPMIHKLHNGSHLPSVLGIATKADGSRDYTVAPKPYKIVGYNNSVIDFSAVNFPVWPSFNNPMPRDVGYSALAAADKAKEDLNRRGVVACFKCHGDPDDAGPVAAPAQGDKAFANPNRKACGSCHDDVDFTKPYASNGQAHPAATSDALCATCHGPTAPQSAQKLHVHPMTNTTLNPGLVFKISKVEEAGTNNADGNIDPGEKVKLTLAITDEAGANIAPNLIASMNVAMTGPINNRNIVLYAPFPVAALGTTAQASFTTNVPELVMFEKVGTSTAALESFTVSRGAFWAGSTTSVFVRTGTGTATTLANASGRSQVYLDVASSTGFAKDDVVVVDDGVSGKEEYFKVQKAAGNKLWFTSPYAQGTYGPWTRFAHAAGATVTKVTVAAKTLTTDFTVDNATGKVTEVTEFGDGNAVLVNYTGDFVMPDVYPAAINDSGSIDDSAGKWAGKQLVDGTYTVGLIGYRNVYVKPDGTAAADGTGDNTTYRGAAKNATFDFLVGNATTLAKYDKLSSTSNCEVCHEDVMFHGSSRRGVDTCLLCHGTAGAEDRPTYVSGTTETPGATVTFRHLLHEAHAETFPSFPGGAKNCAKCHGDKNTAWQTPVARTHPTQQVNPGKEWTVPCSGCHTSAPAQAHFGLQTYLGNESCAICHGPGRAEDVVQVHKVR